MQDVKGNLDVAAPVCFSFRRMVGLRAIERVFICLIEQLFLVSKQDRHRSTGLYLFEGKAGVSQPEAGVGRNCVIL